MMTILKNTANSLWLRATSQVRQPWAAAGGASQKPDHLRVDESTRRVRELTATAQRQPNIVRLKQARLDEEAEDQAHADPRAPKTDSPRKR